MQYKTIALELLQQRPPLHEKLRQERMLLAAVNRYATELKARHEAWTEQLAKTRPGSDPSQLASEALELALKELEDSLPAASPADANGAPSLDAAMAYLRRHMPPA
jgi:hypothetical protein